MSTGDVPPCLSDWRARAAWWQRRAERLEAALQEIKDKQGLVCQEFETCAHRSCRSSCAAWMIADQALQETGGQGDA